MRAALIFAIASVVASLSGLAQEPTSEQLAMSRNLLEQTEKSKALADAGLGPSSIGRPTAHLTADSDKTTVQLRLAYGTSWVNKDNGGAEYAGVTWTSSATVSAPTSKDGSPTTLASLNGLENANTLQLKMSWVIGAGLRDPGPKTDEMCEFFRKRLKEDPVLQQSSGVKEITTCPLGIIQRIFTKLYPAKVRELEMEYYAPSSTLTTISIAATSGYQDFNWYDPTSLAKTTTRKKPQSLEFALSRVVTAGTLVTAAVRTEESYEATKSFTRCPAPTGTVPFNCVTGAIGEPTKKRADVLTLDVRTIVYKRMALGLTLNRDIKNKTTGIELPLYVLSSSAGDLTGGIKLGWTTDDHKVSAGLFIGQPFKLFE